MNGLWRLVKFYPNPNFYKLFGEILAFSSTEFDEGITLKIDENEIIMKYDNLRLLDAREKFISLIEYQTSKNFSNYSIFYSFFFNLINNFQISFSTS